MSRERSTKLGLANGSVVSAGTAITAPAGGVDMLGYDEIWFFGSMSTYDAGNSANLASSATTGGSYTDITGSSVTTGDALDSFLLIAQAAGNSRWIRCEVDRSGGATVVGDIYYLQFRARKGPVTHGSTIDSDIVV